MRLCDAACFAILLVAAFEAGVHLYPVALCTFLSVANDADSKRVRQQTLAAGIDMIIIIIINQCSKG